MRCALLSLLLIGSPSLATTFHIDPVNGSAAGDGSATQPWASLQQVLDAGLVQTRDGLVHRVLPGNHVGQNDGRITAIQDGKISLIEIVPDGMGGFIERPAALALSE